MPNWFKKARRELLGTRGDSGKNRSSGTSRGDLVQRAAKEAEKRKETAKGEAPEKLNNIDAAESMATSLTGKSKRRDTEHLIDNTDPVMHWMKDNRTLLGLSETSDQKIRYKKSRDKWKNYEQWQDAQKNASRSAPGKKPKSPEEVEQMKQEVINAAAKFLQDARQRISIWYNLSEEIDTGGPSHPEDNPFSDQYSVDPDAGGPSHSENVPGRYWGDPGTEGPYDEGQGQSQYYSPLQ